MLIEILIGTAVLVVVVFVILKFKHKDQDDISSSLSSIRKFISGCRKGL